VFGSHFALELEYIESSVKDFDVIDGEISGLRIQCQFVLESLNNIIFMGLFIDFSYENVFTLIFIIFSDTITGTQKWTTEIMRFAV